MRFTVLAIPFNARSSPFDAIDCSPLLKAIIMERCIPRRKPDGAGIS